MTGQTTETPIALPGTPEMEQLEARVQSRLNGRVRDFRLAVRGAAWSSRGTLTLTTSSNSLSRRSWRQRCYRYWPTKSRCLEPSPASRHGHGPSLPSGITPARK